jgi:hypothetical protein
MAADDCCTHFIFYCFRVVGLPFLYFHALNEPALEGVNMLCRAIKQHAALQIFRYLVNVYFQPAVFPFLKTGWHNVGSISCHCLVQYALTSSCPFT